VRAPGASVGAGRESALVLLAAFVALVAWSAPPAAAVGTVGYRTISAPAPERGGTIGIALWYPAEPGGTSILIGDNAIFEGVAGQQDAPVAAGPLPLVLLSHGGLRSAPNIGAWMASRLAARGFVVAVPRQPDSRGLAATEVLRELWFRPSDLAATLTAIEGEALLAGRIDPERVGVLGFLLGGTSALALAGARLDAESYSTSCDPGGTGLDCAWLQREGVDLRKVDSASLERSHLDRRVKAVVAIDPELSASFTRASLAGITAPVHIFNLGRPDTIRPGLKASVLVEAVPHARYATVPDATHYSAFPECKPRGAAILREEGDEALCDDAGDRARAGIHDHLATMVETAFRQGFSR
jgi:predicted dienelactone hydrolase